ncbi:MAG: glycosidase [Ardenticatenaceae bacterium]|nr:glycosidase [Ardenticatenaceae bacterium]MCB9004182.1 glycosidase [Ardenticatenaceae bacterium]
MKPKGDSLPNGVMFNAYPDSCGGSLDKIVALLRKEAFKDVFSLFYILPSLFNSDLDRGFSIVDYGINNDIASENDLRNLQDLGIELKLDFILNHISVQSAQFQDMLKNGEGSPYINFFIDWNKFWEGHGEMGPDGYIIPDEHHLKKLFMRKPELPILKVPFPDGTSRFYWNTFYQQVTVVPPKAADLQAVEGLTVADAEAVVSMIEASVHDGESIYDIDLEAYVPYRSQILRYVERNCMHYLGQMDLNAKSEMVWDYYDQTLKQMKDYGAKIVRLDAFAYLHKEVGLSNFFNEPGTWDYINRLRQIANKYGLLLLPEIHSKYEDKTHEKLENKGFAFYDFFFPGLVINALETGKNKHLIKWIREVVESGFVTVNMLGCHDGIPLLDMKGLLDDQSIDEMIGVILSRGGMVKDLYGPDGKKISYYQVNATFFSALDEHHKKFLLARAIQMFMPGIPEIWYLDLFAGTNDHEAAQKGGHKEINRTNLSMSDIEARLQTSIVQEQLSLLRFRNTFPAFGFDSDLTIQDSDEHQLHLVWSKDGYVASLRADLRSYEYEIAYSSQDQQEVGRLAS